jgi:hypothetical protein
MVWRVSSARAGQQVVLYAPRGGAWWIQPLILSLFTEIQSGSTWKSGDLVKLRGEDNGCIQLEDGRTLPANDRRLDQGSRITAHCSQVKAKRWTE